MSNRNGLLGSFQAWAWSSLAVYGVVTGQVLRSLAVRMCTRQSACIKGCPPHQRRTMSKTRSHLATRFEQIAGQRGAHHVSTS